MLCPDTEMIDDLDLLRKARQGDFVAYEKLVECFHDRVFGLAYRITGQRQDAEDVTQSTFMSLLQSLNRFREEASVSTWILRMATNHSLKVVRKRRGLPLLSLEMSDTEEADPEHLDALALWNENPAALAESWEVQQLINEATAELEEKFRIVFRLRDIEGLSTRETAKRLRISEANVKIRLMRARSALRERLAIAHPQ